MNRKTKAEISKYTGAGGIATIPSTLSNMDNSYESIRKTDLFTKNCNYLGG